MQAPWSSRPWSVAESDAGVNDRPGALGVQARTGDVSLHGAGHVLPLCVGSDETRRQLFPPLIDLVV